MIINIPFIYYYSINTLDFYTLDIFTYLVDDISSGSCDDIYLDNLLGIYFLTVWLLQYIFPQVFRIVEEKLIKTALIKIVNSK